MKILNKMEIASSSVLHYRKKNRNKAIKTAVQFAVLAVLGVILYLQMFAIHHYKEPDKSTWSNKQGFIALSYFGVARNGTPKLVEKGQLDEQLKTLRDHGYTTISQQDILDFLTEGNALPDRALFLSFEDGRNDSSLFAQPLLQRYNFKATFLSYANKMGKSERKFVQPKDMLRMRDTGYWELGSNGYRLAYINLFFKDGRYIGIKDESELANVQNLKYYNHYLMDFERDENMIPLEDRTQMEARINADYALMAQTYGQTLGFVPSAYMIMHANALNSGMNQLVSDVNTENIKHIFKLHFNREGNAFNGSGEDLYNMTRAQVAPYWHTNHLLMKIHKDTGQQMDFVDGDREASARWKTISGAAQFADNEIVLTSPPGKGGLMVLNENGAHSNVSVKAKLLGNVVGRQSVYIRYDEEKDSFLRVALENNQVYLEQKKPGQEVEQLASFALNEVGWKPEDLAYSKATVYTREQIAASDPSEEEPYPINIKGNRELEISLAGNTLHVEIDKTALIDAITIDQAPERGGIALESASSKSNKKDDIYDGVFQDVQISAWEDNREQAVMVFSNKPGGFRKASRAIEQAVDQAINWAIDTF